LEIFGDTVRAIDFYVQVYVQVAHRKDAALSLGHTETEMALTDTAVKALKPATKTYTVADDRGLYAEVFPSGGIVWRFRYRLHGKYEKLTLGKYLALTLKNARLKRDEAAADGCGGPITSAEETARQGWQLRRHDGQGFRRAFLQGHSGTGSEGQHHDPPLPGERYSASHR
jgi:hypothetical protein